MMSLFGYTPAPAPSSRFVFASHEPEQLTHKRVEMRLARPFVIAAGAMVLLSGLGYSVSRYNLFHVYYGEPVRVATGTVLLLTGLYVRKFARPA
jgi:hypothetical protein